MKKSLGIILAFMAFSAAARNETGFRVVKTFHIQSEGGWDYLAVGPNNKLYVSHATQVNILDKTTGDSVGVIKNTTGVHGIAFVPAINKGFISNGKLSNVTVFDLNTDKPTATIKTGENPDAIMYDPFSNKVLVCNGRSSSLSVIDPASNAVVSTVSLDGKPETAVSDEKGAIYVNIEDKNEIEVVDAKTYQVKAHWPLAKGTSPSGLAIDKETMRLFAGCDNKILVIVDATNGKNIDNITIDDGCDGVAFSPALKQVYSSNGAGTLTIINEVGPNDFDVLDNVPTLKGARTIAMDETTHLIYLPTADFQPLVPGEKRPKMVPGTFKILVLGRQ